MIVISLPVLLVGLYFQFENSLTRPWARWAWWACSLVFVSAIGWYAGREPIWADFTYAYYQGGKIALKDITQLYTSSNCIDGFVNFPLLAYLFAPFALFSSQIAGQVFYVIGYISIIPLAYWLIKLMELNGWKRWLILGLIVINDALDRSLWVGNTTQIVMVGLLLSLWWLKRGKEGLSGVLLGLSGLIKLPLILPAIYFFVRQRWRVVMGGGLVVGLAVALSLLLTPLSLNLEWLNKCVVSYSGSHIVAHDNQSLGGLLARQFSLTNDFFSWSPVTSTPELNLILKIITVAFYLPIGIMIFFGWGSKRTSFDYILEFSIVLVCSVLTSPISWIHYYVFLFIPIALYLKEVVLTSSKTWSNLLFGFSVILLSNQSSLAVSFFERTGNQIFLSLYFIGGVILYALLLSLWLDKRSNALRGADQV